MREYFFKVRKKGTRGEATKVFGVKNPEAYRRQMNKAGYTVLEYGSLKSNWRQIRKATK